MSCVTTDLQEECFTVTWSIQNFEMCTNKKGKECLVSPTFCVETFEKTKWQLKLHPKGDESEKNDLACYLFRAATDGGPQNLKIVCDCAVLPSEDRTVKAAPSCTFTKGSSFKWDFTIWNDIVKQKCLYLPRGTLTIRCQMWMITSKIEATDGLKHLVKILHPGKTDGANVSFPEDLYSIVGNEMVGLKRKLFPYPNECNLITEITVGRRSFDWSLKSFSSLKASQKMSVPVTSAFSEDLELDLAFYLATNDTLRADLQHKPHTTQTKPLFVVCKVTVLDERGEPLISVDGGKLFELPQQAETWTFAAIAKKTKLLSEKDVYLPEDELRFRCEISVSDGTCSTLSTSSRYVPPLTSYKDGGGTLGSDLRRLYVDRNLADLTVTAEKKTFMAHKAVLCARSPVFAAMFENNMKEKKSHAVYIEDVDAATVDRLLTFLYCVIVVHNPGYEVACKLYSAADKYEVISLRDICASQLVQQLSVGNACEVLSIAHLHEDDALKNKVQCFIYKHSNQVLVAGGWTSFMENNLQLAAETMHKLWIMDLNIR